jgi:hypothetical protein
MGAMTSETTMETATNSSGGRPAGCGTPAVRAAPAPAAPFAVLLVDRLGLKSTTKRAAWCSWHRKT